jgi:sulfur carrier protein
VRLMVNGDPRELPDGATVADVVTDLAATRRPSGVAVAVNGEVVSRRRWSATALAEGDRVEVLAAIQGG